MTVRFAPVRGDETDGPSGSRASRGCADVREAPADAPPVARRFRDDAAPERAD